MGKNKQTLNLAIKNSLDLSEQEEYELMPPCLSVWIDTGAKNILDSDNYIATAVAPTDNTKYDRTNWNNALGQDSYHAFYIEFCPSISYFELLGNKFSKPTEILFIASDNTIIARVDNRVPIEVNCQIKGILFLYKDYHEHILPSLVEGIFVTFTRMK
ncbi:MAG: hypothetical protein JNM21_12470 [Taibaiella sp.]|nr:hypothetical protein [Taibaiella sp.]